MLDKANFPLIALKALQPWLEKQGALFEKKEKSDNYLVRYESKEHEGFHFTLKSFDQVYNGEPFFNTLIRPYTEINSNQKTTTLKGSDIEKKFNHWVSLLQSYHDLRGPHDELEDDLLNKSQEEIYNRFNLNEEDAYTTQYDIETQRLIDKILDNTIALLEDKVKEESDEEAKEMLRGFIGEATYIRGEQGKWVKGKVAKNVAWLFAKVRRYVIDVFYDILKDAGASLLNSGDS